MITYLSKGNFKLNASKTYSGLKVTKVRNQAFG